MAPHPSARSLPDASSIRSRYGQKPCRTDALSAVAAVGPQAHGETMQHMKHIGAGES